MRLIDAEFAKKAIDNYFHTDWKHSGKTVLDVIDEQQTIDVNDFVKHGKWVAKRRCSVCCILYFGYDEPTKKFKYCPNCGAKMDLEDGEDNDN